MAKKNQTNDTYNEMFSIGGADGAYDLPYYLSPYYPMYKQVLSYLKKYKVSDILEVGCGTGAFAKMISEKTSITYRGFDFSEIAIQKASQLLGRPELFSIGDATQPQTYAYPY